VALKDLASLVDPRIKMPIRGKVYTPPPLSGMLGLYLRQASGLSNLVMSDADEAAIAAAVGRLMPLPDDLAALSLPELMLGPAYGEMISDGVPDALIWVATKTLMISATAGDEAAEAFWNSGGDPKALLPSRAARRAAGKPTDGATATRSPANGSGTSSRRKKSRRQRAPRSTGPTSSPGSPNSSQTSAASLEST
jgi:hypothetical protein